MGKPSARLFQILFFLASMLPVLVWSAWNDGVGGENGFNVPNGGSLQIKQWSTCRELNPSGCPGTGVFVPTKTQLEWRQFTSNIPSCVSSTVISCQ